MPTGTVPATITLAIEVPDTVFTVIKQLFVGVTPPNTSPAMYKLSPIVYPDPPDTSVTVYPVALIVTFAVAPIPTPVLVEIFKFVYVAPLALTVMF